MNPVVKAKWLEAFRSGTYAQGQNRLRDGGRYCCLGVLCELHRVEVGGEWGSSYRRGDAYLDQCYDLPSNVQAWAELQTCDPRVGVGDFHKPLSVHNDKGTPFTQIADLIEVHL